MRRHPLHPLRILLLLATALAAGCRTEPAPRHTAATPTDSFAPLVARLSEPGGYFDTDNLISNETSYLHALGPLRRIGVSGGAYIGVGPDQNFAYIAQIRPEIALIIDIRRDNLLQQLWFKALFQLARDRADYLALMFGRPRPRFRIPEGDDGLDRLVAYFDSTPADPGVVNSARAAIHGTLSRFGVPLSPEDIARIDTIHDTFIDAGLGLRFTSYGRAPRSYYPTYRDLLLERDLTGRRGSYLAREADFDIVKELEDRDRVIPVVGDLAGEHALPEIARYLQARGIPVSAFYTSNVEFYLMRQGGFGRFATTVVALPRKPHAVFIRSYFHPFRSDPVPASVPGYASTQIVQPMERFVERVEHGGGYGSYFELVTDVGVRER